MKKQLADIANSDFARLAYADGPVQNLMATAERGRIVAEYYAKAFYLTDEQLDALILQIASGENTFADLARAVPALNSPALLSYVTDVPPSPEDSPFSAANSFRLSRVNHFYFKMDPIPSRFAIPYEFRPTDRFTLALDGLNRLYVLKKEAHLLELAEQGRYSLQALFRIRGLAHCTRTFAILHSAIIMFIAPIVPMMTAACIIIRA